MSPHRTPGERDERVDVEPLHRGPRSTCPACGAANVAACSFCKNVVPLVDGDGPGKCGCSTQRRSIVRVTVPVFCGPPTRVRFGWLRRRCQEPGQHLHQRCTVCGARWLRATAETVQEPAAQTLATSGSSWASPVRVWGFLWAISFGLGFVACDRATMACSILVAIVMLPLVLRDRGRAR